MSDSINTRSADAERSLIPTSSQLARCSTTAAQACLPYESALKLQVLPLALIARNQEQLLTVACCAGREEEVCQALRFVTGHVARAIAVPSDVLSHAIFIAYHQSGEKLAQAASRLGQSVPQKSTTSLLVKSGNATSDFLSYLIEHAAARQASDIHLVPMANCSEIRLRLRGELHDWNHSKPTLSEHAQMVSRLKVLSGLDVTVTRLPQDGALCFDAGGKQIAVRIATLPTIHGEKVVLRLLGLDNRGLHELGYDDETLGIIQTAISKPDGLVLIAGPVGSGKSSTLYAIMRELHARGLNVASAEDPVEQRIEGIAQTQVDVHSGLTFACALRALLRQDPNVLAIGEMRDQATAEIAFQAALTGHLVLSTLHVGAVAEIPARLKTLGIESSALQSILRLSLVQRLVPSLCPHCRVTFLNTAANKAQQPVGCHRCDYSGSTGRVPAVEYQAHGETTVMRTMQESMHRLLNEGLISERTVKLWR